MCTEFASTTIEMSRYIKYSSSTLFIIVVMLESFTCKKYDWQRQKHELSGTVCYVFSTTLSLNLELEEIGGEIFSPYMSTQTNDFGDSLSFSHCDYFVGTQSCSFAVKSYSFAVKIQRKSLTFRPSGSCRVVKHYQIGGAFAAIFLCTSQQHDLLLTDKRESVICIWSWEAKLFQFCPKICLKIEHEEIPQ